MNTTFYRLPSAETFARWRDETPDGFRMSVKASRFITHVKRLRDCAEPVETLLSRARALGPKLGPVLFQLLPSFPADPELLRRFLSELPRDVRAAFEFRDASWLSADVLETLDRASAALVLADRPYARAREVVTGGWSYLRFHEGRRDAPGYTREKLRRSAGRIASLPASDVFAYFNNDTGGAAVRDARTLAELLHERGVEVAA